MVSTPQIVDAFVPKEDSGHCSVILISWSFPFWYRAIYVWCRRTDELVDGPNASRITPAVSNSLIHNLLPLPSFALMSRVVLTHCVLSLGRICEYNNFSDDFMTTHAFGRLWIGGKSA